ncbi:uncharacterized protein LACBIDRAFT_324373 [Laccaria bicolor S238N-H82]|uniref:Predicted protein n=1 Tax=Laccaria bicolor (strain S238N-H82 / ATCC MYA-4686) TaxID=486041 RepID=B0D1M4_LACBS|nr:uncharacterized protein LACBIDRAFT_324373 [Laccaria bicolor S238N-H82]EDR12018.1 predicted protein [Laccaria bicolor S238N-H82]|eukprot:XP_001877915.1 predicted protein [Laccaria bicolor S238N-H82]
MTNVSIEATWKCAQALEVIIYDVIEGQWPLSDFAKHLQDAGTSPAKGEDYLQQLTQRLEQQKKDREAEEQPDTQSGEQAVRESTPEGLDEAQAVEFHAWREVLLEESLPATVLALALHLAELSTSTISDPYIEETWKLWQEIGTDKTIDSLVNLMQVQPLADPIPHSIWCLVIKDYFVNFKKHSALMDKGAWSSAVMLVYCHRSLELQGYQRRVTDLFCAVPHDLSITITFDVEACDHYVKSPFHMDNQTQLNVPLLARMAFAASVKANTEQRMNLSATLSSRLDKEKELVEATQRAAKAKEGPRSINLGLK